MTLKLLSGKETPTAITAFQLLFGGGMLILAGVLLGGHVRGFTMRSVLLLLYMALLSTVAFSIWALLLKYNPVGKVAVFGFTIPVFGVALSAVFLGEDIWKIQNLAALILVSAGIIFVNREKESKNDTTKELIYEYEKRDEEGNIIGMKRAIDGVDIDIPEGSFVAILGHNGSGKSTLAKHMNAILVPSGGTMWVNGRDTKDPENLWDVRQSAGMVFQNPDNQIIGTVVEEDVGFGPENLGVPADEIWKRVEESLKDVGMLEYRKSSPNKLSGGQKQRVAIAGVIAMEPKCIVLDEPTAMLDPNGRKEVIETLPPSAEDEKSNGDPDHPLYGRSLIEADQVFVMDKGHVVMHGTPKEVFSQEEKLKKYRLDVPQVTMLADELKKKRFGYPERNPEERGTGGGIMSIELKHIQYVYGQGTAYEKQALKDVSLEIPRDSFSGSSVIQVPENQH